MMNSLDQTEGPSGFVGAVVVSKVESFGREDYELVGISPELRVGEKVDPMFGELDEMVGRPDLLEDNNGMGTVEPVGIGANVDITA